MSSRLTTSMTTPFDEEREQIRRALSDPWRVVVALGLDHGAVHERRSIKIICPWCGGGRDTPPCSIRARDGVVLAHCFSCNAGGDVFALVAQVEGLDARRDFPAVCARAASLAGINAIATPTRATAPRQERRAHLLDASAWHRGAVGLLGLCPLEGSVADGLADRGILAEAQADGWGELPADSTGLLAALRERALLGFLPWLLDRMGQVYKPSHRLCIPWRASDGRLWCVQRRYAPHSGLEPAPEGDKYREPAGSRASPLGPFPYGVEAPEVSTAAEIWLVEGATDVLALRAINRHQPIPRNMAALGLPGVGAWKRVREQVLPLVKGRVVSLAFDSDAAGVAAVEAVQAEIYAAGAIDVKNNTRRDRRRGCKDWCELTALLQREGALR